MVIYTTVRAVDMDDAQGWQEGFLKIMKGYRIFSGLYGNVSA